MDEAALTQLASVVICAQNRERLIVDTLESVLRNHPGEVVVIDDESTDGTAAVARRFTDRVIASGGHGLAAARQLGAEQARCRYVVYVDSDVVVEDGCLSRLVQALESDDELGAVTATRVRAGGGSYLSRSASEARDYLWPRSGGGRDRFPCTTVAVRRRLILDIGFDPFFVGAGEDIDFSTRLHAAGWGILQREDAVVHHRPRDGSVAFVRQHIWYGRGTARLRFKRGATAAVPTPPRSEPGWRRHLIRDRRFSLLPYLIVSGAAHRVGLALEQRQLRRLPDPVD